MIPSINKKAKAKSKKTSKDKFELYLKPDIEIKFKSPKTSTTEFEKEFKAALKEIFKTNPFFKNKKVKSSIYKTEVDSIVL